MPDRDAIVMAFGDAVVPQLKGVAKAIYSAGRFVAVADGVAVFSLDNAPTRDRAEKYRAQVEQMLADRFGSPVPLRLVTEADADAYAGGAGPAASSHADPAAGAGSHQGDPAPSVAEADSARRTGRGAEPPPEAAKPAAPEPGQAAPAEPEASRSAEASPAEAPVAAEAEDEVELIAQVDQLEDADVATNSVDKVTAAFPGAQLIDTEDTNT